MHQMRALPGLAAQLAVRSLRETAVALLAVRLGVGPVRGSASVSAGRVRASSTTVSPSPSPSPSPSLSVSVSTSVSSARRLFSAASASMCVASTSNRCPPTSPASRALAQHRGEELLEHRGVRATLGLRMTERRVIRQPLRQPEAEKPPDRDISRGHPQRRPHRRQPTPRQHQRQLDQHRRIQTGPARATRAIKRSRRPPHLTQSTSRSIRRNSSSTETRSSKQTICTCPTGFAEYAVADERFCFAIPDDYPDHQAAPLLCAGLIGYRALRFTRRRDEPRAVRLRRRRAHHRPGRRPPGAARLRRSRARGHDFARELGAVWAGTARRPSRSTPRSSSRPPASSSRARSRPLKPGGTVVCAGIHMSDIPAFPYELLWRERTRSERRQPHARATARSSCGWRRRSPSPRASRRIRSSATATRWKTSAPALRRRGRRHSVAAPS